MDIQTLKYICGTIIIAIVAGIQGFAWYLGKDGQVFAFTCLVIGGIAGALFGFSITKKSSGTNDTET